MTQPGLSLRKYSKPHQVPCCSSLGLVSGLTTLLPCRLALGLCPPEIEVDRFSAFGTAWPPGEMGPKSGEAGRVANDAAAGGYGLATAGWFAPPPPLVEPPPLPAPPPPAPAFPALRLEAPGDVESGGEATSLAAEGDSRGVNLNDAALENDADRPMCAPPAPCCCGCGWGLLSCVVGCSPGDAALVPVGAGPLSAMVRVEQSAAVLKPAQRQRPRATHAHRHALAR